MSDKPKRPMSAYMLWLNSARESIKADHPGLRVTEVAKKGGEIWRGMKDKSVCYILWCCKFEPIGKHKRNLLIILLLFLQVWEEKAAEAKEKYTRDLESYNANGGGGEGGGKKAQKRGKKAPKKAAVPVSSTSFVVG